MVQTHILSDEQWSDGDVRSVLEVPIDTTDFALSFDGTTEFSLDDINYEVVSGQETVFDITTETYEVELPASPLLTGTSTDASTEEE